MKGYTVVCDHCGEIAAANLDGHSSPLIASVANRHEEKNPGHNCAIVEHPAHIVTEERKR